MDKEKRMLHTILDTVDDGIYVIAKDFTVEFMNRKMIDVFGDGVGRKCHEVINNSDTQCEWCRSSEVFAGERIKQELYMPKVDRTFNLTELPLTPSNSLNSSICSRANLMPSSG